MIQHRTTVGGYEFGDFHRLYREFNGFSLELAEEFIRSGTSINMGIFDEVICSTSIN